MPNPSPEMRQSLLQLQSQYQCPKLRALLEKVVSQPQDLVQTPNPGQGSGVSADGVSTNPDAIQGEVSLEFICFQSPNNL